MRKKTGIVDVAILIEQLPREGLEDERKVGTVMRRIAAMRCENDPAYLSMKQKAVA